MLSLGIHLLPLPLSPQPPPIFVDSHLPNTPCRKIKWELAFTAPCWNRWLVHISQCQLQQCLTITCWNCDSLKIFLGQRFWKKWRLILLRQRLSGPINLTGTIFSAQNKNTKSFFIPYKPMCLLNSELS